MNFLYYFLGIHEKSFVTFICASELNMLISSILLKKGRITKTVMTKLEIRSLKYKIYFTVFNMTSFAIAGYCFLRHNAYCESGGLCINKITFSICIHKYIVFTYLSVYNFSIYIFCSL